VPAPAGGPLASAATHPVLGPAPRPPRALAAPPSARVAPAQALSGKLTVVIVKPGDSLWKFAASRLGDGRRWQELLSLNPGLGDPKVLKVGSELVLHTSLSSSRSLTKYDVSDGYTLRNYASTTLVY